ncbi:MAG: hypothetical protein GXO81_03745 [Chlorobi bacterium]|nr:hypothetical protein [Chlorobiota bacterium]
MKYKNLIINNPEGLMFGKAPFPVKTRRGLEIGGGQVYSELNFTLPTMSINSDTLTKVNETSITAVLPKGLWKGLYI